MTLVEQILASSNNSAWTGEGFGSARANAEDMAKVLSRAGITDVGQLGVRTVEVPATYATGESGDEILVSAPTVATEYFNKSTGQPVEASYDRAGGNIFSGTFKGKDSTSYGVQFDANGKPMFYTQQGESTSDAGKIAPFLGIASLALGLPGIFGEALNSGLGLNLGAAGTAALGGATTGGLLSGVTGGDVLQGAVLGGVSGYVSGSNMFGGEAGNTSGYYNEITGEFIPDASGGLQGPLTNLSGTNIGSMDGYSYDPATQTWTDPTGAQTTSITGVTNGTVTGQELLNSAGAGAATVAAGTGLTTSQIANLVKAGVSLAGITGATGAVSGGDSRGGNITYQTPTQGTPVNNPGYYNQLQQYYNAYMPNSPRDVVSPLQDWYSTTYGGAPVSNANTTSTAGTPGLFSNPTAVVNPVKPATVIPSVQPTYNSSDINNWLRANPGATDAQVVSAMQQFGITTKQMADATGISLSEIDSRYNSVLNPVTKTQTSTATTTPTYTNTDITNWLSSNPGASDATVAAAMNQFGITPNQMASATGIDVGEITQRYNAALGTGNTTNNTVNTVQQQPQYSNTDITNWLSSNPGAPDSTVASAMQQFGITPAQMASATGIGLDEITQRYNAALGR